MVVRKQISFFCCELFNPAFYAFLKYGFLSLVDSFTANKIILSRLLTSTLAELVDKSRQEIVKTVIKIMKIISGSLVVYRK